MIRKAHPLDIPAIVNIAVESVSQNPIPVIIDTEAMADSARECLSPSNFLMVSEIDGEVVGAVAAQALPSFWHRGSAVSVLLFYVTRAGDGVRLLKALTEWIKSRPRIKVAIFELEPEVDERLIPFLKRQGFTRESKNLVYLRGMPSE